ncbi:hypothetical protein CROQUDRAFT_44060, partial [Cronartium quercuum f. sp. fusiforme G11]
FYSENLETWKAQNNVSHSLATFCDTQWLSVLGVCLLASKHKLFFQKCSELEVDPTYNDPDISKRIQSVMFDNTYFSQILPIGC